METIIYRIKKEKYDDEKNLVGDLAGAAVGADGLRPEMADERTAGRAMAVADGGDEGGRADDEPEGGTIVFPLSAGVADADGSGRERLWHVCGPDDLRPEGSDGDDP